jgi:hypothetical protein
MVKHPFLTLLICGLFFVMNCTITTSNETCAGISTSESSNNHTGWIETISNITIVHIKGSFYEMGYQYGSLLHDDIIRNLRGLATLLDFFNVTVNDCKALWEIQKNYIRQESIDYIQGTADALNLELEEYAFMWVFEGIFYSLCTSYAAWGPATQNKELIHVRSMDGPWILYDPQTHEAVQDYPVLVVADPDQGHAFLYPTYAGYVTEDGFNDQGISICSIWSPNYYDRTVYGAPMGIRTLEVLYSASTAEEAIAIMTENETFGYNFILCDGKKPEGYAVESTANHTYIGTWNDPSESNKPFWKINSVVRRTNCFLNRTLASLQREIYSPRDFRYVFNLIPNYGWFPIWSRFKSVSTGIEKSWGTLDLENSLQILRKVYTGGYTFFWSLICKKQGDIETWWQWSISPRTGDMMISFATSTRYAFRNPYVYFNLYELLDSQPK